MFLLLFGQIPKSPQIFKLKDFVKSQLYEIYVTISGVDLQIIFRTK